MKDVVQLVYKVVSKIPKGEVSSYGQIAMEINRSYGKKVSPRWIGRILHFNPDPKNIPCHRVIFKDGSLSRNFAFGGMGAQKRMLLSEGVSFTNDGKVNLSVCLWKKG